MDAQLSEVWGADMTAPRRIQLSRVKGWRMPPNTVKVDRSTMWGNHAAASLGIKDHALAVECFKTWIDETASLAWKGRAKIDLRGKNLACWCALGAPSHADVLLEIANRIGYTNGNYILDSLNRNT